ncbi:MAG TPA: hypothetical protein IAC72_04825 [Candidatus Fimimonas merdipullorum]|uniref:Uncharacterized protein n=1 Tax=Candidatus Fimimonas merdipullorum TaxID=2840822 RepID=A0A9D1SQD7_9BACT|nr:hypothetical protein [Candidatus Fimimonas merdipullorum]
MKDDGAMTARGRRTQKLISPSIVVTVHAKAAKGSTHKGNGENGRLRFA